VTHNEVRYITASLLSEVCQGVTIEPYLQPLSGSRGHVTQFYKHWFWRLPGRRYGILGGRFEKAFLDVRVNPGAQLNRQSPPTSVYRWHEQEKRRQYEHAYVTFKPPGEAR